MGSAPGKHFHNQADDPSVLGATSEGQHSNVKRSFALSLGKRFPHLPSSTNQMPHCKKSQPSPEFFKSAFTRIPFEIKEGQILADFKAGI